MPDISKELTPERQKQREAEIAKLRKFDTPNEGGRYARDAKGNLTLVGGALFEQRKAEAEAAKPAKPADKGGN